MSALRKNVLKKTLPPFPPGAFSPPKSHGAKRQKRDYSPLPWSNFFDRCEDVKAGNDCFRVYFCGKSGPLLLLLHGGGHSALSWAVFTAAVTKLVECQVAAVDIRGHGDTVTEDDSDLSAETLVNDVGTVTSVLYGEEAPPIVLIGHSMGGAIAARAAAKGVVPSLVGLAVIDVVEGTAMNALTAMHGFLRGRPRVFRSLEQVIEWSIRSEQLHNVQSARVSMPGQVIKVADTREKESHASSNADSCTNRPPPQGSNVAMETISEREEEQGKTTTPTIGEGGGGNATSTIGEGGGSVTSTMGEGGGSATSTIWVGGGSATSTLGEEGGSATPTLGEEGGSTTFTLGEEGGSATSTLGEEGGSATPTLGEEGGNATPTLGEEGGGSTRQTDKDPKHKESSQYTWRIDLTKTECHWRGWFDGLSKLFLSSAVPKMLILAGVDRLDKELTIGQMQGKFQMQVLSGCGHAVHEDVPDKVAKILAGFLLRHKFSQSMEAFQRLFPAC